VRMDPSRRRMGSGTAVFQNLVGDAVKFSGDAPPVGESRPAVKRRNGS
jgi:hypothetical protein